MNVNLWIRILLKGQRVVSWLFPPTIYWPLSEAVFMLSYGHCPERTASKEDDQRCGATVRVSFKVWTCHHHPFGENRRVSFKHFCEPQAGWWAAGWAVETMWCFGRKKSWLAQIWGVGPARVVELDLGDAAEVMVVHHARANLKIWGSLGVSRSSSSALMMVLAIFGGFLKAPFPSVLWLSDNVVFY